MRVRRVGQVAAECVTSSRSPYVGRHPFWSIWLWLSVALDHPKRTAALLLLVRSHSSPLGAFPERHSGTKLIYD